MELEQSGLKETKDRIGKLERQNRQIKRIGAVSLIVLASLVVMGQASPDRSVTAQTVTAREFVLSNSYGEAQARLFVENGAPVFEFKKGTLAFLKVRSQGEEAFTHISPAYIQLANGKGVGTSVSAGGLMLADGKVALGPHPGVNQVFVLPTGVSIYDKEGFATQIGQTKLQTVRTGQTSDTSAASVVLLGKDGRVLWSAP